MRYHSVWLLIDIYRDWREKIPYEDSKIKKKLEMWANAQADGRPAEHRWRPLFNAAKFSWRPLLDAVQ